MRRRDFLLWITILLLLTLNLFFSGIFTRNLQAQAQQVPVVSAGEQGTVYFFDGANLWVSQNYGGTWNKIR